ncbi:conjugal transfer protein TraF [Candidatus Aerophobetes bacterium]|nr:conjugal transfer protein TraF [Candidatus Aerophobetes bacterium]
MKSKVKEHKGGFIKGIVIGGVLLLLAVPALAFTPSGTKALTMGGAFTAIADDQSSVFWNPAGITQRSSFNLGTSLSVTGENIGTLNEFYNLYRTLQDKDYETAKNIAEKISGKEVSLKPTAVFGIELIHNLAITERIQSEFKIEKFKYYDEEPNPYIEIEGEGIILTPIYLTFGGKFSRTPFSGGINVKYIQGERYNTHLNILSSGDFQKIEEKSKASPLTSFDIGILYKEKGISGGLMVENLLEPEIKFSNFAPLILSRKINIGVSFKPASMLTLSSDVHNITDKNRTYHIGGEINLTLLKLRMGSDNGDFTYGLGLKLGSLNLDFAYFKKKNNPLFLSTLCLNI